VSDRLDACWKPDFTIQHELFFLRQNDHSSWSLVAGDYAACANLDSNLYCDIAPRLLPDWRRQSMARQPPCTKSAEGAAVGIVE
jgi:hypothetical protein